MNVSHSFLPLLHLSVLAFFTSLIVTGLMIFVKLMDMPGARSQHTNAVPTGGGVGIGAGLVVGMVALVWHYPALGDLGQMAQVCLSAGLVMVLGLLDDIYDIRAAIKFLFMTLIACLCVYHIGPPQSLPLGAITLALPYWIGFLGAVLWVFVVMNVVNFMDGMNGLMASVMMVAFAFLCVVALAVGVVNVAILSAVMIAGLAGFLPYNMRRKALLFSGDVGALLVGFIFAICILILVVKPQNEGLLYVGPLLILPFLCDVFLTLFLRARQKKNLLHAHRDHLYQRCDSGGRVVVFYVLASIIVGIITVTGVQTQMIGSIYFLAAITGIAVMIYRFFNAPDQRQMPPAP